MLQPYEYNYIKGQISHLINVYKTVNDKNVILTIQESVTQNISPFLEDEFLAEIKPIYLDKTLTNAKAVTLFETIEAQILPFKEVSDKQIEKVFRKVKKIKYPKWDSINLKATNYLAWDDIGTQRKYITFYHEERLTGCYGVMSTDVIKNVCAICHKIDNVAMFLTTTRIAGDGTYTKKGNYICKDSQKCNQQMEDLDHLHDFYHTVAK